MPEDSTQMIKFTRKYCTKCYGQFEQVDVCPEDGTQLTGPENDPLVGKRFAERYDIDSVLGLGGMSIVYKAHHRLMDRVVAIKMLHSNIKHDHVSLERFRLEAQAASALNHQNIISVYDFGVSSDGDAFFVMDFLDGESLAALIERKGKVPYERAMPIFKQICDGLGAAHKKSIVHRDLKPANIVLIKQEDGSELVKLVDFGIAKLLPGSGKEQQHLTKTGEVFGSPIYMSPEQCQGLDLDRRSDIYALGCLMYETLTGAPPLLGSSFLETLNKHVGEMPKSFAEVMPDVKVPAALEQIIMRCMSKKPEDRFQTADEIRDQLSAITVALTPTGAGRAAISGPMPPICPDTAVIAAHRRVHAALIVTALISVGTLVSAVFFLAFWPGPADDPGTPLAKLSWQISMSNASDSIANNKFEDAENQLSKAESLAQALTGGGKTRLEGTLKLKTDLYTKWEGHAELLEKANVQIADLQTARVQSELKKQLKSLLSLDSFSTDSAVARSSAKLRAEAELPSILSISSKLYGRKLYAEQAQLLEKAIQVEKKLQGEDSQSIALLESARVDGLLAMRKFFEVRPLLLHVCAVYKKTEDDQPNEYVRALAKLGQFDVDQNEMGKAEPELQEALKIARAKKVQKELQVLCMRSWADLLNQTKRQKESQLVMAEADALEQGSSAQSTKP